MGFLQYTSLAISNIIEKGHSSCNIIILPGQSRVILKGFVLFVVIFCETVHHHLAVDSWHTSVIMRRHRWHNSNKQTVVLFGLKILIKSETYCLTQNY